MLYSIVRRRKGEVTLTKRKFYNLYSLLHLLVFFLPKCIPGIQTGVCVCVCVYIYIHVHIYIYIYIIYIIFFLNTLF